MADSDVTFKVGDLVEKYTGDYQLTGEIRAVFTTKAGNVRCVVEHEPGFLHIYGPQNLRLIRSDASGTDQAKVRVPVVLRDVKDPDTCANCKHLLWGPDQGWDKCRFMTNGLIAWKYKASLVCDNHERKADSERPEE